jgi:photosystem I protein PsaO
MYKQMRGAALHLVPLPLQFRIYMVVWHLGLFSCLFFGQIGVQGRKQGYW